MNALKMLLAALVLASTMASAADRCGGVKLEAGHLSLGKPLSEAWVKTAEGKNCLTDLVAEVDRNRLVRAITVAAIGPTTNTSASMISTTFSEVSVPLTER